MAKYIFDFHFFKNAIVVSFPEFVKEKAVLRAIKKAFWKLFRKKVVFKDKSTFDILTSGKKRTGYVEITSDGKVFVNIANNGAVEFDLFEIDPDYQLLLEDIEEDNASS